MKTAIFIDVEFIVQKFSEFLEDEAWVRLERTLSNSKREKTENDINSAMLEKNGCYHYTSRSAGVLRTLLGKKSPTTFYDSRPYGNTQETTSDDDLHARRKIKIFEINDASATSNLVSCGNILNAESISDEHERIKKANSNSNQESVVNEKYLIPDWKLNLLNKSNEKSKAVSILGKKDVTKTCSWMEAKRTEVNNFDSEREKRECRTNKKNFTDISDTSCEKQEKNDTRKIFFKNTKGNETENPTCTIYEDNSDRLRESQNKRNVGKESLIKITEGRCKAWTGTSTYEEIMCLVKTIDGDVFEDQLNKADNFHSTLSADNETISGLNKVHSFLDEIEKQSEDWIRTVKGEIDDHQGEHSFRVPSMRLENLMKSDPIELAREVLTMKILIEDQKKGIQILREALNEMKKKCGTIEREQKGALKKANAEAEILINRHQKFISQLLSEKINLNGTITKLILDLKLQEKKYKKNVAAMEERHRVELKRVRKAQCVASKIKQDKWIKMKTQKIKEMTIKGLEPELSRLVARQQQEMKELQNSQKAELDAAEARASQETSRLVDELKAKLLNEKNIAIDTEKNNLRKKLEQEFQEERRLFEVKLKKLQEEIFRLKEKMAAQESEFQKKIGNFRREANEEKGRLTREFQEKLEEMRMQNTIEVQNIRECCAKERDILNDAYKKQESIRFLEMETQLRDFFKKERDRDLKTNMDALEKQFARSQLEMNKASENKIKKFQEEIKKAKNNETIYRDKLLEVESQILAKEELVEKLNARNKNLQDEYESFKMKMTLERNELRRTIREEFENELSEVKRGKELLEKEIVLLKNSHAEEMAKKDQINFQEKNKMQKELVKVYNRIQTITDKKEMVIELLKKESEVKTHRCLQLETLLDNQRRNLLLR